MGKREIFFLCLPLWALALWLEAPGLSWCYGPLLLLPALEDWRSGYISDGWSVLLFLCGVSLAWRGGFLVESLSSAGLTLLIYGLLYGISRKSLGEGDLFLGAAAAAWLTPLGALLSLWLSAVCALLYVGALAALGKFSISMEIRFAPFIAMGGLVTYALEKTTGLGLLASWLSIG